MIKRKSFTLVESLIAVVLFLLLISVLFQVLLGGSKSWNIGAGKVEVENQAILGLNYMAKELSASSANTIKPTPPLNNANNITFQLPVKFDSEGNILWGDGVKEDYSIKYRIGETTGKQLIRERLDAKNTTIETKILANDAQSLGFSLQPNSNILTIILTTQKTTADGRQLSQELTTQVTFRNQ